MTTTTKVTLGITALVGAGALLIGAGIAFFSDVITGSGTATAGTLDISGTITLKQNGEDVTGTNIANFNPGDLISFNTSAVENNGNKSAWIRGVFEFTSIDASLAGHLWVCTDGETQADLNTASLAGSLGTDTSGEGGVDTSSCKAATVGSKIGAKETYTVTSDVIAGTGIAAETDGGDGWTPTTAPEIYFDAAAPNSAQGGDAAFSFLIQALQYANNTDSPDEDQWGTVVDIPFPAPAEP